MRGEGPGGREWAKKAGARERRGPETVQEGEDQQPTLLDACPAQPAHEQVRPARLSHTPAWAAVFGSRYAESEEAGWGDTGLSVALSSSPRWPSGIGARGDAVLGVRAPRKGTRAWGRSLPAGTNPREGLGCGPRSGDRPERVLKVGVLPTPRPVSEVLLLPRLASQPRAAAPAVSGHGPVPAPPDCASNCPRSRLPFPLLISEDGGDTCPPPAWPRCQAQPPAKFPCGLQPGALHCAGRR